MITALNVINDPQHLPATHIAHARKWRKSQVSPMGGRIILEVLSCKANRSSSERGEPQEKAGLDDRFVRLNVNDGITPLPDCADGPGQSCPLAHFVARTKRRGGEVGNFKEVCRLEEGDAEAISFLKQ